ncbi:NAD-dependent epimerase/dehydratase family protein [Pelomonas sp. CA6]|uniref:NAD-dependent epimerase/dehydratase family protein n=1 Tax=Pelomonas sp. CA6 TaxID=2907999 RepID=UPI001F4BD51D|nr:NAD-dependent epimerase/dehydratase family protein [Pelomonas sp. CA6]MCH7344419.1 NAD-dependent epimerase/dehydratase family protein [Pelomonas sp. CA6]
MSKFVVTGARGYVARHLIRRLVADGHEVVGLTRGGAAQGAEPGSREVAVGDYSDEAILAHAVSGARAVFHLAARAHQRSAGEDDAALFHAANVVPTEALARACAATGVTRLVMASSIGVLGNRTDAAAFSDATPPAPVDPYALSKALAERRVAELLAEGGCDYCIVRPPLVYGPGSPGNFAGLVAIAAKAPLIPLAGIRAPRTFIHVDHLVDALVVAGSHPAASRRTFVVADGADTSVAEIVRTAAWTFGRERWRVVAIPEALLRTLAVLAGQRTRIDKLLAPLRVDGAGFQEATGWRPARPTSEAIAATLRDWPGAPTP